MSKDGWLPPGVTDADIDRACPGYDDEETSMTDIVERLERMLDKAEAELARLRAENERLTRQNEQLDAALKKAHDEIDRLTEYSAE